jgi:quercetin dioxygenase-like cupin family protein
MKKMAVISVDQVEASQVYPVPVNVTGLRWSKLLSPPDYVLWLCLAEFAEGGELQWSGRHSDQAIYVFEGELTVGGQVCPERGTVVVESDVPARITATKAARIGHWGAWDPAVPDDAFLGPISDLDHGIHLVGPKGLFASGDPDDVAVRSFANSACPTCRISLFEVTRNHERPGRPHAHSADEIIFLTSGTIHLGALVLKPGTSLCIPGGVRYAEGSGADGAVFLNYRRQSSDRTDFVKGSAPVTAPERAGVGPHVRRTADVVHVHV